MLGQSGGRRGEDRGTARERRSNMHRDTHGRQGRYKDSDTPTATSAATSDCGELNYGEPEESSVADTSEQQVISHHFTLVNQALK